MWRPQRKAGLAALGLGISLQSLLIFSCANPTCIAEFFSRGQGPTSWFMWSKDSKRSLKDFVFEQILMYSKALCNQKEWAETKDQLYTCAIVG